MFRCVHLCVVSQVQVSALWMESSGTTSINMSLIERLQQPHEVGAVRLKVTQNTRKYINICFNLLFSLIT